MRRELLFESPDFGFRLLHDAAWYITGEQSDLISLRYLQEGVLAAHCNISSLPARSAGRETTLEQFEREVRESIGEHLEKVTASRQWTTSRGNSCLGVIATGKVRDLPFQWRYYLVSAPNLPRVSLALTIEQSQVERFADAERALINSLELLAKPAAATAAIGRADQVSR